MLKIQKKILILFCIITFLGTFDCLSSLQFETEFFPELLIPNQYKKNNFGDLTIIHVTGLPDKVINVVEKSIFPSKPKQGPRILPCSEYKFYVTALGFLPGLPVTYTFQDDLDQSYGEITIIPNKIYSESLTNKARIEAKLISLSPANYEIIFENFDKNEEISFTGKESQENKILVNHGCKFEYSPAVINEKGGVGYLTLTRSSGEIFKLQLPWGLEWAKYIGYYTKDGKTKFPGRDGDFKNAPTDIVNYLAKLEVPIQIKTKFYTFQNIPEQYRKSDQQGDLTLISIKGLPDMSKNIYVTQKHILSLEPINCPSFESCSEYELPIYGDGYIPGLPVVFTFHDLNKNFIEEVTIIPKPLYVESKSDKARIEAKIFSIEPINYEIVMENFGKKEKVLLTSVSGFEKLSYDVVIENSFTMALMPELITEIGGIAHLTVKRPSGEILKLELPWGMEWAKYVKPVIHDGVPKFLYNGKLFLPHDQKKEIMDPMMKI